MVDFEAIKDRLNLVDIAGRYVELRKAGKEFCGPCPKCGGSDRFHIYGDRRNCHCRQCGGTWDAISLYSEMEGLGVLEAAKQLAGDSLPIRPSGPVKPAVCGRDKQTAEWETEPWQVKARGMINAGKIALLHSINGKTARDYLYSRGFSDTTITKFDLGFNSRAWSPKTNDARPAIVMPWVLPEGKICAVKYRFIDQRGLENKDLRFSQVGGGRQKLFGARQCRGNGIIVAIEGDMNCLSVHQDCHRHGIDCVSFGPERNKDGQSLAAKFIRSRGYEAVVLWCDEAQKAIEAAIQFDGPRLVLMQSPLGKDANTILQEYEQGSLYKLISHRINPAPNIHSSGSGLVIGHGQIHESLFSSNGSCEAGNLFDCCHDFSNKNLVPSVEEEDRA